MKNQFIEAYKNMTKIQYNNIILEAVELKQAIVFKYKYREDDKEIEKMVTAPINIKESSDKSSNLEILTDSIKIVSQEEAKNMIETFNIEQKKKVDDAVKAKAAAAPAKVAQSQQLVTPTTVSAEIPPTTTI